MGKKENSARLERRRAAVQKRRQECKISRSEGVYRRIIISLIFAGVVLVVVAMALVYQSHQQSMSTLSRMAPTTQTLHDPEEITRCVDEKFKELIVKYPRDDIRSVFAHLFSSNLLRVGVDPMPVSIDPSGTKAIFALSLGYPDGSQPHTMDEARMEEIKINLILSQVILDDRVSDEQMISFLHHEFIHMLQLVRGTVAENIFMLGMPEDVDSTFVVSVYEAEVEAYLEQSILAVEMGIVNENDHFIEYQRGGYAALRFYVADEVAERFPRQWRSFLLARAKVIPRNSRPTTQGG